MITLLPTTSEQEFNIIPRDFTRFKNIDITITEDGSGATETFTDATVFENGDYICVAQAFTILRENYMYYIEITNESENWWRGKARCTSQTDTKQKHTLRDGTDEGFVIQTKTEDFPVINS